MATPSAMTDLLDERTEYIATQIVDAAFQVHNSLGPGLLESVYVECLVIELQSRGLKVEVEMDVPIFYRERRLSTTLRLDLLVEDTVIVEAKSTESLTPVFFKQTRTYMRLAQKRLGFLINFNVTLIKDGIKRMVL